jgi:hypothetical protein
MNRQELAAIMVQCSTQHGALALAREIEERLERPPPALARLVAALGRWDDPVAIDDCVRDLLAAVDPIVEIRGSAVRTMLEGMAAATGKRARAQRRARATARRKGMP